MTIGTDSHQIHRILIDIVASEFAPRHSHGRTREPRFRQLDRNELMRLLAKAAVLGYRQRSER